jgi:hypothetical protein
MTYVCIVPSLEKMPCPPSVYDVSRVGILYPPVNRRHLGIIKPWKKAPHKILGQYIRGITAHYQLAICVEHSPIPSGTPSKVLWLRDDRNPKFLDGFCSAICRTIVNGNNTRQADVLTAQ